jgi:crotonobetainyl-CoA:carnitine CoA-transferase CaiB-like acyl-CoA transferase
MLAAFGRSELAADPRFVNREQRVKNFVELTRLLGETVVTKPRAHWMGLLEANDVPFAPVHSIADVLQDPQVRHLQTFYTLRHPTEGDITAIRRPVRIDGERNDAELAPPTLGEHTDAVLAELGYDDAEIAKLRAAAVI